MITISTYIDKNFYSSFLNLQGGETGTLDVNSLTVAALKSLIIAELTKRVIISSTDLLLIKNKLSSLTNGNDFDIDDISEEELELLADKLISTGDFSTIKTVQGKGDSDVILSPEDIGTVSLESLEITISDLDARISTNTDNVTNLINNKSDKYTTLSGYGITDSYTKDLVYTKVEVDDVVEQRVSSLVGIAPTALDTIEELAQGILDNQDLIDTLNNSVGNRVRFDVDNQPLTITQKTNARTNIEAEKLGTAAGLISLITPSSIGAAIVATTGSYNDLVNKPIIPASQVNSDWSAVSGLSQILNKPNLAAVATSGSYNDLSNKPTLSTVASTGSYGDLTNKPSNATTTVDGFMSSADKTKLDGLSSSGGLTHFVESFSNTGTNATTPVIALGASAARTEDNISVVLTPKGTGAFIVGPVPAGSVATGNARAAKAIDIQTNRTAASQVASGNNSIAIGQSNTASGDTAIALGVSNNSNGQYSVALGSSCTAGYGSISLGNTALSGIYSFAAGLGATANHGIAIGYNAKAQYSNDATLGSMGIGYNAASRGNSSIAIGNNSKDNGYSACVALGSTAQISGHFGIAIGNNANSGDRGISIGLSSSTSGAAYAIALGLSTTASGSYSTVVGYNATDKGFTSWVKSLGGITVKGDWQERLYMPYATTTSSATTSLTTTGASTTTTNAFSFSTNGVFVISGHIMAKSTSTTPTVSVWEVKAVVKTGATASTAEFVGTPTITNIAVDTDASTWTVSLMLNASKQLVPVVNGADTVTIRWGANLTIKELLT